MSPAQNEDGKTIVQEPNPTSFLSPCGFCTLKQLKKTKRKARGGSALRHISLNHRMAQIGDSAAPLLTLLFANVPGQAMEDSPSAWALAAHGGPPG